MSDPRMQRVALKLQRLEAQAREERAALLETLEDLQRKRFLGWVAGTAQVAAQVTGRFMASPGIRWLVAGAVLRRLRRGKSD